MLNLNSFLIGSGQPRVLVDFYTRVFARKPDMVMDDYTGWLVGPCFITIGPHSKITGKAKEPQRVIFNLETDQVKEEFTRIKALGAEVISEPYQLQDAWIATLADPDGNYFQLMTPWKEQPGR